MLKLQSGINSSRLKAPFSLPVPSKSGCGFLDNCVTLPNTKIALPGRTLERGKSWHTIHIIACIHITYRAPQTLVGRGLLGARGRAEFSATRGAAYYQMRDQLIFVVAFFSTRTMRLFAFGSETRLHLWGLAKTLLPHVVCIPLFGAFNKKIHPSCMSTRSHPPSNGELFLWSAGDWGPAFR